MAKATAKSSSKASVKVVINEHRRHIRPRKVVQKKMVELPPVRIYHEYFSVRTTAEDHRRSSWKKNTPCWSWGPRRDAGRRDDSSTAHTSDPLHRGPIDPG